MKPRYCRECGVLLEVGVNWYVSLSKTRNYLCMVCNSKKCKLWRHTHKEHSEQYNRDRGILPMAENKACSIYLGVYVAERILSKVFKDVKRMPCGHKGYDFICNKQKKIDVKSSCRVGHYAEWLFHIRHNEIADYFLCIAFDNRDDLNPLHLWFLPGDYVNSRDSVSISLTTIHKWDSYKLGIDKVVSCCATLR